MLTTIMFQLMNLILKEIQFNNGIEALRSDCKEKIGYFNAFKGSGNAIKNNHINEKLADEKLDGIIQI